MSFVAAQKCGEVLWISGEQPCDLKLVEGPQETKILNALCEVRFYVRAELLFKVKALGVLMVDSFAKVLYVPFV